MTYSEFWRKWKWKILASFTPCLISLLVLTVRLKLHQYYYTFWRMTRTYEFTTQVLLVSGLLYVAAFVYWNIKFDRQQRK